MADVAVVAILMVSMGLVMWIGNLVTKMVGSVGSVANEEVTKR
jgi:hypothetical protein